MKTLIHFILIVILLSSCNKVLYDHNYQGQPNYNNGYVVDTITIFKPVRILVTEKGLSTSLFISEADLNDMLNYKIKEFIKSPKVYFQSDNLYNFISPTKYPGFKSCTFSKWEKVNERISLSRPLVEGEFLLVLCNVNSYNQKESYSNFKKIAIQYPKSAFVKVVYPICK